MSESLETRWLLLQSGARGLAENMAVDEFLLEHAASLSLPILRFYSGTEPGATFGYSQHYSEVAALTELRPLIRRPTGGGLVPHDNDWTYSCAIPPTDAWYHLRAAASYRRVHQWLADSFRRLGIDAGLAVERQTEGPGQCFVGAEVSDVLRDGRKLAGAAQRRSRSGLLIQGSVQPPPPNIAKADWQKAICDAAHCQWGVKWIPLELDPSMEARIEALTRNKYGTTAHNRKR